MTKAYLTRGAQYLRYDVEADRVDTGYPRPLTGGWSGLDGTGFESGIDASVDLGAGKVYLFRGELYLRLDNATNAVDGQASAIAGNWPGFAENGFTDSISAAVNWGTGKAYFFRGDQYLRYDLATDTTDEGYPLATADGWPGLVAAGFTAVDTAWVRLAPGGSPGPTTGGLSPGDHVWYWDGLVSNDKNIPRTTWFPSSVSETDYLGHGKEIFNFVVHSDGTVLRGQPHMRGFPGSHAWLNHNPGNLTGVPGGPDYGQYPDKFNWHNFLVFPSHDTGYAAIAAFLRGPGYRDLDLTAAFRRYAPASDGNNPDQYARDVATAAGVSTTTLVRDLDDDQMRCLQEKIEAIEGTIPGDTFAVDSPDLPAELRTLLG